MSVVGLVPIASFESWDGEQYQTTQIAIWTAKEEKRTRDLYAGFDVKFDPGESSLKILSKIQIGLLLKVQENFLMIKETFGY